MTIPKPLRDRLGIRPGERLEFTEEPGRLVVRKADIETRMRSVFGTLKLPGTVDEAIEEMRGPVVLPPEP